MRSLMIFALLVSLTLPGTTLAATLSVAYLELADDARYDEGRMEMRIPGQPWGRPFVGAEVAAKELRFPLMTVDTALELERMALETEGDLEDTLRRLHGDGTALVMLDLPAALVERASDVAAETDQVLFNVSAGDVALREAACSPALFHLLPSETMRMDALAQYLVQRRWSEVLLIEGPEPADERVAKAFRTAAERYGLDIVEQRRFVAGNDPRQREANNPDLLTRGSDFDAIFVADADGEFAQRLPYRTRAPRPVVGSGGLIPTWWHWNWQRHGAPQLNNRFERAAERLMTGYDWSAWIGIKAIGEAVLRTESTDPATIAEYLRSDELVLDGFQGYRLSFRDWNNQLRSAVFLTSADWVAARAPFEGFLHPRNDLDSLGRDAGESECAL